MKLLVLGSGGREHALCWKLLQSSEVKELIWAPGQDAGILHLVSLYPDKKIQAWEMKLSSESELDALVDRAKSAKVEFVVVGPDALLAAGIVDRFEKAEIPCFGPSQSASKLEWSKAFAKDVMQSAGVPTAAHHTARTEIDAEKLLHSLEWSEKSKWVLKADGLALGKGVVVCEDLDQALAALPKLFAYSGEVVIEERLYGEEISWLALCDGETAALLDPARDYKTIGEEGTGANTGGMGAISPIHGLRPELREKLKKEVFQPVLSEMKKRGTPFRGVLYAGLMISEDRYWVLEFNARFGDPETQVLLPRMEGDLLPWLKACATPRVNSSQKTHTLSELLPYSGGEIPFKSGYATYVVASAKGYPEKPELGDELSGVNSWMKSLFGFFAGIRKNSAGGFETSGGRVLGALGFGDSPALARKRAYLHLEMIDYEGKYFRRDIG